MATVARRGQALPLPARRARLRIQGKAGQHLAGIDSARVHVRVCGGKRQRAHVVDVARNDGARRQVRQGLPGYHLFVRAVPVAEHARHVPACRALFPYDGEIGQAVAATRIEVAKTVRTLLDGAKVLDRVDAL